MLNTPCDTYVELSPHPALFEETLSIDGHVKWYDLERGYGFIIPQEPDSANTGNESGSVHRTDVLIHASCIKAYGLVDLKPGTPVRIDVIEVERGRQAKSLTYVDEEYMRSFEQTRIYEENLLAEMGPLKPARVKWFDKDKGFGFLNLFGQPDDVFLHVETLRRYGKNIPESGDALVVRTSEGPRGLSAITVADWEEVETFAKTAQLELA